jgi:hypothetical protein
MDKVALAIFEGLSQDGGWAEISKTLRSLPLNDDLSNDTTFFISTDNAFKGQGKKTVRKRARCIDNSKRTERKNRRKKVHAGD